MTNRTAFVIPDYPRDRPTCAEIGPLVRAYYAKPNNGAGGVCHVVLDDGNLDRGSIEWCLDYAQGDADAVQILQAMLNMTPTQRRRLLRWR